MALTPNRFFPRPPLQCSEAVEVMKVIADEDERDRACSCVTSSMYREWWEIDYVPDDGNLCACRLWKNKCTCGYLKQIHPPGFDHPSFWRHKETGQLCFVVEPYGFGIEDMKETVEFCERHGLTATISANSWHFPGHTVRVEFRNKNFAPMV